MQMKGFYKQEGLGKTKSYQAENGLTVERYLSFRGWWGSVGISSPKLRLIKHPTYWLAKAPIF